MENAVTIPHESLDRNWHAGPDVPPPERVWLRLERTHARYRAMRRGAAALAIAAVAAGSLIATQYSPAPAPLALEDRAPPSRADLRAIDRALQAAYERDASDAEIRQLWIARQALSEHPPAAPPPVRI